MKLSSSIYRSCLLMFISIFILQNSFAQYSYGIGTTTPHSSAVLDITSSSKGLLIPRLTLAQRPASPATGLVYFQTDGAVGFYYFNGSIWKYINTDVITGTAGQIPVYNSSNSIAGTNSFVWDNTNNRLGIGTSSPSYALEVNTSNYIVSSLRSNHTIGAGINLNSVGNSNYTIVATNSGSGAGVGKLGFYDETVGAYRMVIDGAGNLGLGVTSPSTKLEISGAGGLKVSTTNTGTGTTDWIAGNFGGISGNRVVIGLNNGNATIGAHNSTLSSWANLLLNPGGGNVGIGTTSPASGLHVKSATSGAILSLEGTTAESYIQFYPNSYASGRKAWLGFGTGGTDFRITNENNGHIILAPGSGASVGIGNTNPQQMLDVTGTIRSSVLAGTGNRMVIANTNGDLTTQTIISDITDDLGNHTATQNINLATNKLVGNGGTNGIAIANDGTVTVNTLAGTGYRMVVASASGDLSTQTIGSNVDGMGNHTASQNMIVNGKWISNNGTSTGIVLNNSGHLGINFAAPSQVSPLVTPQGLLDVPKYTVSNTYAGYFGPNIAGLSTNVYSPSATNSALTYSGDPQNPFRNINTNVGWSPYMGNSYFISYSAWTIPILTVDFGVGNAKVIRRFLLNCRFNLNDNSFARYHFLLEGSNDGTNFTYIYDVGNYTTMYTNNFCIPPTSINNTIAYRYYRFKFGEVKINSTAYARFGDFTVTGIELNEEAMVTSITSGGLLAATTGNIGIGTATPTTNLDVQGSLRLRNGAGNNQFLKSDASGNATWSSLYPLYSLDINVPAASYPYILLDPFVPIPVHTTPTYGALTLDWNHNLGYQPTILYSLDQTDAASSALEFVDVSYQHIDNNTIRFKLNNMMNLNAIGKLRIAVTN